MPNFEDSYVGRLRKLAGSRKLILPGPRAAITDDQGRLLLIRRSDNHEWAMPAGTMELEESVYGALQREVKEETGLDVRIDRLINIYSYTGHTPVIVVYAATMTGGSLACDDEGLEAKFFVPEAIPWDELAFRSTDEALREFLT